MIGGRFCADALISLGNNWLLYFTLSLCIKLGGEDYLLSGLVKAAMGRELVEWFLEGGLGRVLNNGTIFKI